MHTEILKLGNSDVLIRSCEIKVFCSGFLQIDPSVRERPGTKQAATITKTDAVSDGDELALWNH